VGLTSLLVKIFNRRILKQQPLDEDTYWLPAKGYEEDMDKSLRQS